MSGVLLQVAGLGKRFGGFVALDGVSLEVRRGERLGLIGPNGSGKTTLINCISGALYSDAGTVRFDGRDVTRAPAHTRARLGIARTFQIPKPFASLTVLENLQVPLEYAARSRSEHRHAAKEAMRVLQTIGLQGRAHEDSAGLTQVDMRKLELARALAAKPSLLIADEAMAGLSGSEVADVLQILLRLNQAG
ncbi:MAG: ABC transporter ATP-binding protein, partial [Burkholderiales bacterium]